MTRIDDGALARGEAFLWTHARLLERRVYERVFCGGSADAVVASLRAYQNPDGGFGHALEPDLRTPASQPLFVDFALATLQAAETNDADLVAGACEFIAGVARPDGTVPYVLPGAMESPRASHWAGDFALAPSLNATAALSGRLHALGGEHEWLDRATAWCFEQIEGHAALSGHVIDHVFGFLTHAPDRERAESLWDRVAGRLFESDLVATAIPMVEYGLTPLQFAPRPDARTRALFEDRLIEDHLDYLATQQQEDGGWAILWEPPGPAAVCAWRSKVTLDALRTLRAYGRI